MAKISAIDFANSVRQNKQRLIQHCLENGVTAADSESLDMIVVKNNTINAAEQELTSPICYIFNYDGTLISATEKQVGDQIIIPIDPPTIDDPLIEFDAWTCTTDAQTVSEDYAIMAACRVKEQIDVGGTLVRPSLFEINLGNPTQLSPTLRWRKYSNTTIGYIDWGDGTVDTVNASAVNGTSSHTYAAAGIYMIKMYSTELFYLNSGGTNNYTFGSYEYNSKVTRAYLGSSGSAGNYSFYNCISLSKIIIPRAISELGSYCFSGCKSLKTLIIPRLPYTNGYIFHNLQIDKIILGVGNQTLGGGGSGVFYETNIKQLFLPSNLVNITNQTFQGVKELKKLKLPSTVISLGHSSFVASSFEEIILPSGLTRLGQTMFRESQLKKINLQDCANMTSIEQMAFFRCINLENILLPSSLTTIGGDTFYGSGIKSIVIPDNVSSIADNVFNECYRLTDIIIPNNYANDIHFLNYHVYGLTSTCLISIANRIKDLTGQTARILYLNSVQKCKIDNIYVDQFGSETTSTAEGAMTLTQFIINKNWTITIGD